MAILPRPVRIYDPLLVCVIARPRISALLGSTMALPCYQESPVFGVTLRNIYTR